DVVSKAVNDLYRTYLQRDATPDELSSGVALLGRGVSLDRLRIFVTSTPEYVQSRGGGSRTGYVSALLGDVFGAAISPRGQRKSARMTRRGSSESVARKILGSTEARNALINGLDRRFLLRPANSTSANDFANRGRNTQQIAANILASPEYTSFRVL